MIIFPVPVAQVPVVEYSIEYDVTGADDRDTYQRYMRRRTAVDTEEWRQENAEQEY